MKALEWYIYPNGVGNNTIKYPYHIVIKKCDILIINTRMAFRV
jgi:hypothetical protein